MAQVKHIKKAQITHDENTAFQATMQMQKLDISWGYKTYKNTTTDNRGTLKADILS
jgi:hypothetical protein